MTAANEQGLETNVSNQMPTINQHRAETIDVTSNSHSDNAAENLVRRDWQSQVESRIRPLLDPLEAGRCDFLQGTENSLQHDQSVDRQTPLYGSQQRIDHVLDSEKMYDDQSRAGNGLQASIQFLLLRAPFQLTVQSSLWRRLK